MLLKSRHCCQCGVPIKSNPTNMCVDCLRNEVDITEGIPKQCTLHYCKNCTRYLQPPNHWVACVLESRELLALCLKKLRGLSKVRLVDAGFIWTEPHSRRIKVKLVIQKEVYSALIAGFCICHSPADLRSRVCCGIPAVRKLRKGHG